MNCESVRNVEDLYTEGRLSPSRKEQVEAHIKDCPACAGKIKNSSSFAGLKSTGAPKDLKERMKRMLDKIETAEPAPAPSAISVDSEFWPVAASIAIYLGLALLLAWVGPGVPSEQYSQAAVPAEATK